jgi:pimeloyl-ACP methyl ester carboxylesterase
VTGRRTALIAGGVAAGAIAAGAVGRTVLRRRADHDLEAPLWDLPPDDLGPVSSFDGTQLAVRAAGDPAAPMLLFVHGFSLDMTTWREQWVDLSVDHRCVLMDQRGHGASAQPADGDLSVRSMGRDIAAVLEAVAPDRQVVVVGHSMRLGSIRTAAQRVDRLRKAVLASPTDLRGAVVRLTQFGPDAPRHVVEHVVHLAERASSEVWTDGLAGLLETDLRHVLPRIRQPALVVVGEHDRVTPPASGLELAAALPDGRFVLLQHAGHIAMMERPVELDREIRAFSAAVLANTHPPRPRRRAATKRRGDP